MAIRHSPVQEEPIGAEPLFAERIRTLASTRVLLTIIFSLAVLLRVGSALYQGNSVTDLPGIYDQMSYHELAIRVADGHGFSFGEGHWSVTPAGSPAAHCSYLHTPYLIGLYRKVGVAPILAQLL